MLAFFCHLYIFWVFHTGDSEPGFVYFVSVSVLDIVFSLVILCFGTPELGGLEA